MELKAKNACVFAWSLSLFSISLHILFHFLLISHSLPQILSFFISFGAPGQLDLFL